MEPLTVSKAVLLQHSTSDIMADVLSIAWTELLGEKAIWEFRRRLWVDMRTQWRYELDCTEVSTTYTQYQVWIYWQIDYDMKAWISMRCINKAMCEQYFMWHCMSLMVRWYEDKWAWTSFYCILLYAHVVTTAVRLHDTPESSGRKRAARSPQSLISDQTGIALAQAKSWCTASARYL